MPTDYLEVELLIKDDQAEVVLAKNKQKLKDFAADVERTQPNIKFKIDGQSYIDLDKLEKKSGETRKAFDEITKVRLDKGQLGFLTKEIVVTSERARQLQSDISSIKRELVNPNRTSSIKFLTQELQAAEKEADQLNRKLSALPREGAATPNGAVKGGGGSGRGETTEFQRTILELADDFAPVGLNRPFNAVGRELIRSIQQIRGIYGKRGKSKNRFDRRDGRVDRRYSCFNRRDDRRRHGDSCHDDRR